MMPMPTTATPEREGRCVLVRVSLSLLQLMMTAGSETVGDSIEPVESVAQCSDGLPRDATLVRAAVDPFLGEVQMIFAHASFRAVPAGVRYPHLLPTFRQVWRVVRAERGDTAVGTAAVSEAGTLPGDASGDERRAHARKKRGEAGGYVPVTPLGPPPRGADVQALTQQDAAEEDHRP